MRSGTLPLTVDLLGVNERMRNTFAMVFAGPAKTVARLAEGQKADLVIVDADGVGAREIWRTFHEKNPYCPVIAISAAAVELEGSFATLTKPVKIDELIEIIKQMAVELVPDTAASTSSIRTDIATIAPTGALPAQGTAEQDAVADNDDPTLTVQTLRLSRESTQTSTASAAEMDFSAIYGTIDAIDCSDEAQVERFYLPLDGRLLGKLQITIEEAKRTDQPIALHYDKGVLAIFAPGGHKVSVLTNDALLQRLSQKVFPDAALSLKKTSPAAVLPSGSREEHPDALLWKVAAWTYRGKLPAGLSPNQRIYLRHWPNLTRLLELPDAMRIAALLNEQPMTMCRIAEALQIPQRHVFAFCACAHAIGLLGLAKRDSDHLFEPPAAPPVHGERKFFGRVMHYLKGLMAR